MEFPNESLIEHAFPTEMMYEREKQLIIALLDCAGVFYDINFTKNMIIGNPIQVVDGVEYPILDMIGKQKNCTYTEIVEYWSRKIPSDEIKAYFEFSDIERIKESYTSGTRILKHKFQTVDILGNLILAEQKIVLYIDKTNGDLLGLVYISTEAETEYVKKKNSELNEQYEEAAQHIASLQKASANLPGGYHRCSIEDGYPFIFVSKSFEKIMGYTKKELEQELGNKFINLIIPEDLPKFDLLNQDIAANGHAEAAYRIRRRDGEIRWIQDSSLTIDWDGLICLQSTISDITEFVNQQEQFALQKTEFDYLTKNIPCGYHRCTTDGGFLLDFISDSFLETVGYQREEILGTPFLNLVHPDDREKFMKHEPILVNEGKVELVYRIVRKDGTFRWIKDSTMRVKHSGRDFYQCILADITEFVTQQEKMMKTNLTLMKKEMLMETLEETMPGGYHRLSAKSGFPFDHIGNHFTDIVGFTREEIETNFGNLFENLIWDEDAEQIKIYDKMLENRGHGNEYHTSVYRIKHKNGGYRWVTDSTMFVDMGENSFFQAIISDITEYIEALDEAKKDAEASSLAKSTFLFNASHDIRTPMNAIKGFAHIIEENPSNQDIVRKNVRKIQHASDTLMNLMNDILDLSRIERGKEEINAEAVYLYDHSQNMYEMFSSSMKESGIDFKIENSIKNANIICDPLKLTRIGMNMLSNAKKFTSRGGSVVFGIEELSCDTDTATYRFYTKDTGIGMSEEFLTRAFEQFERERTSTESGVTGSGLGLSIIKKLVELMGGTVDIKSKEGKGTEISTLFTFPLAKQDDILRTIPNESCKIDMHGKKVLLVEDNEFNREIARYILEEIHFTVDEAENGLVCVNKLLKNKDAQYDLILMDLQMPIMDGYNATAEIRSIKNKNISSIPIIAMTANAFDEDRQKCFSAGMNGHIAKPIDISALLKEISRIKM